MIVHDALLVDNLDEFLVHLVHIIVSVLCLVDQPAQVFRVLSTFGHSSEEVVQCLLVLVLTAQVVLKVGVDLVALVDELLVVGEHDEVFGPDLI